MSNLDFESPEFKRRQQQLSKKISDAAGEALKLIKPYVILPGLKDRMGRIYSREQLAPYLGTDIYGHIGTVFTDKIDLANVSHIAKNVRIEGDDLVADLKVLDTPMGNILRTMLLEECNVHMSMQALGMVNMDNTVSDLKICSINMLVGDGEMK